MKSYENKEKEYITHYLALPKERRMKIYEYKDRLVFIMNKRINYIISAKRTRIQYYAYNKITKRLRQIKLNEIEYQLEKSLTFSSASQKGNWLNRRITKKSAYFSLINIILNFAKKHDIYFHKRLKKSKVIISDLFLCLKYPLLASCYYGHDRMKYCKANTSEFIALFKQKNIERIKDFNHLFKWLFKTKSSKLKKLFIKHLKDGEYHRIIYMWYFVGLLKLDYLVSLNTVNKGCFSKIDRQYRKKMHTLFKNYSQKRICSIFSGDFSNYALDDLLKQYFEYPDKIQLLKKPKSINELHDDISRQYRRIKEPYKQLAKNDYLAIDGQKIKDITIKVAKDNHTLSEWGEIMHNCIASYKNSKSALIGLYRDNELIYNLEISKGYIRQFYGKHNSLPKSKDKELFENYLKEYQKSLIEKENTNGNDSDYLVSSNCSN